MYPLLSGFLMLKYSGPSPCNDGLSPTNVIESATSGNVGVVEGVGIKVKLNVCGTFWGFLTLSVGTAVTVNLILTVWVEVTGGTISFDGNDNFSAAYIG